MRLSPPPGLVSALAGPLLSSLARSWRVEAVGDSAAVALIEAGRPYILVSWHDVLLPVLWWHRRRGITILVSEARDGRYLAAYAGRLGYRSSLGSSSRGAVRALLGAVKALRSGGAAGITPDGPRGPRRVLKPGVLLAAEKSGAYLVPVHAGAESRWRLKSWDRMLVPKPFARVRLAYGTPFQVSEHPSPEQRAAAQERLLAELATTVREAQWDDEETATG